MICKELLFSDHAITQMFKRSISVDQVKKVLDKGEIINSYLNDKPYPSFLLLGYIDKRPIHLVIGNDEKLKKCIVITAYEPDPDIWISGFKFKKS